MKKHLAKLLFWLTIQAALALIIFPASHLAPMVRYLRDIPETKSPAYAAQFPPAEMVGESAHFILQAPPGYLSQSEIDQLLDMTEGRRFRLIRYLEMPDDETRVTMRLNAEDGIPYCGTQDINFFALRAGHTSVIHELTHYLMGYPNGLLAEGLAIVTEDRFGWGLSFPNMLRPVQAHLYNFLRRDIKLVPLDDLRLTTRIYRNVDVERSRLRYLQSASFAHFLIGKYGKSAFLAVYRSGDFVDVFGKTISELENGWLGWIRRNHILQAAGFTLAGLAVIGLFHLGHSHGRRWLVPASLAFVAFFVWDYYLVYSWQLPLVLMAALLVGGLATRFSRRWGPTVTWGMAVLALMSYVLMPAIF